MGTKIEAVCTSRHHHRIGGMGAIDLADEAAHSCLERAGRKAAELDFLINAGVYRDNNLGEPAVAAIIQEDIGANPDPPVQGGHGTFSFDVVNGACGVLNAMHILDSFLTSGAIDLGMVVTSDADPELGTNWDFPFGLVGTAGRVSRSRSKFPFAPVGGAALLSRTEGEGEGFSRFAFTTYPEFQHLFDAAITWHDGTIPSAVADAVPGLEAGSNVLQIHEREGFAARAVDCADESVRAFLDSAGLEPQDIDLLVPSPAPPGFPDALSHSLGILGDRVARVDESFGRVHTAGPLAALEAVMRNGQLDDARNVLFATVAAGITVCLALYHP